MATYVVLLGGPGAGKGTQAKMLQGFNDHLVSDQVAFGDAAKGRAVASVQLKELDEDVKELSDKVDKIRFAKWAGYLGGGGGILGAIAMAIQRFLESGR